VLARRGPGPVIRFTAQTLLRHRLRASTPRSQLDGHFDGSSPSSCGPAPGFLVRRLFRRVAFDGWVALPVSGQDRSRTARARAVRATAAEGLLACHCGVRVERHTRVGYSRSADGHRRSRRHETEAASRTDTGKCSDCAWSDSAPHTADVPDCDDRHVGMHERSPERKLPSSRLNHSTAGSGQ
jgi:hypothetical protein